VVREGRQVPLLAKLPHERAVEAAPASGSKAVGVEGGGDVLVQAVGGVEFPHALLQGLEPEVFGIAMDGAFPVVLADGAGLRISQDDGGSFGRLQKNLWITLNNSIYSKFYRKNYTESVHPVHIGVEYAAKIPGAITPKVDTIWASETGPETAGCPSSCHDGCVI
jgi:hypothetical protein